MATISLTDAENRIDELLILADGEPIHIELNGVAKYQLISTDHYVSVRKEEYELLKASVEQVRGGTSSSSG